MIFEGTFKFEIALRESRSLFCLLKPPLSPQKWLTRRPLNNHECIVFCHMYSCIHYSKWREQNQFHAWGCFPCDHVVSHLQCTTMGPASGGLHDFTRLRKARKGVGCSGTPWSGQAVNWNCLTSLFSLEPFWRRRLEIGERGQRAAVAVAAVWYPSAPYFKKGKRPDAVCR